MITGGGGGGSSPGLPIGLPGATAPTRYVGGTASGAPVTGTFAVGDFVIDDTGAVWVCTAAGTPGTWTTVGGAPLARRASTGTAGYTLINGTGTAITWNTPNDGQLHTANISGFLNVTTAETGGSLQVQWTDASGAQNLTWFNGGQALGRINPNNLPGGSGTVVCLPNTAVSIVQNQALTLGASVLYATILGA